jgi:uncharacterized membrane protein
MRLYGLIEQLLSKGKPHVRKMTEGTSALFLLTGEVTLDKVQDALKGDQAELIQSNLCNELETRLRDHFSATA